jgi:exosome complex RNA-binding protein Rrp4
MEVTRKDLVMPNQRMARIDSNSTIASSAAAAYLEQMRQMQLQMEQNKQYSSVAGYVTMRHNHFTPVISLDNNYNVFYLQAPPERKKISHIANI